MSNRTVIVIAVVAAALFAFIYFYDRDRMTTSELEGRKDRVFSELKTDLVDRIEIQGTSGEKISLVRGALPKDGVGEAEWRIESPKVLDADGAAVREVLSALDFLVKKRVVKGAGEREKPQYGLERPAVTASFSARGATTTFRIGAGEGPGDTVYVAVDGRDGELYAVEKDFRASLDKGLDELRDKHLVAPPLDGALGIEVERSGETVSVSRDSANAPWRIERNGAQMLAAGDQVASLLADIGDLRAEEFVSDGAAEASFSQYGLDQPGYRISVTLPKGETVSIQLGGPCPKDGSVYANVAGSSTVACVSDAIATSAGRPVSRFVETRPLVFGDDEVEKIAISRGGKSLAFERDEEKGWIASGHAEIPVDGEAIAKLLTALRETRAKEAQGGADSVASLGAPDETVELTLEAGKPALALSLFSAAGKEGTGARARRGDEDGVLVFDKDLRADLPVDLIAYRDKTVDNGEAGEIVSLDISGPSPQKLERDDDGWKLVSPAGLDADGNSARSAAELVAMTKVERFVAEKTDASHGFASPYAKVTARFEKKAPDGDKGGKSGGEKSVTLELGAAAGDDGSRYGRFTADGVVFVLGKEGVDRVTRPLVSRDLVTLDPSDIAKISLTAGASTLTASRDGDAWKADSAAVNAEELKRKIDELGALRAIRGEAFGPAAGFDAPSLKLEAWTQKQLDEKTAPTVITFGAKTADAKENGYTARKSGAEVTMVVPARLVDELLSLVPNAGAAETKEEKEPENESE